MADIRVTFVLQNHFQNEFEASDIMIQAYNSCKELVSNISWVKETDLNTHSFSKRDYLVFETFDGKDFTKYIDSKCAVVGPLAISVCLIEGKPIPSFQWPILNVAMYGCEVSSSQLSKKDKEAIQNKVRLMGGYYNGDLTDSTTHLICGGTNSKKYMLAAEKGALIMLPSWIDYMFELSEKNNVSANDKKILEKYKCPPFYKLTICATGLSSSKEKEKLQEIISANGGNFLAKLLLSKTDVLICHGSNGITSEKYKAARRTPHISCVTIDWIYDSVEKGYALPRDNDKYRVKAVTSTPTKDGENIDPNFSTISAVGQSMICQKSHIDDTVASSPLMTKRYSTKRKADDDDDLVEKLDIKKVKNAGHFLDGCSVFVAGFNPTRKDKLNKIINISGATRYDDFSDRVTHVIVGDPTCSEVQKIKSNGGQFCLVTVQWLLDSVEQQKPAEEKKYFVLNLDGTADADRTSLDNGGSPLSKKALSFLTKDKTLIEDDVSVTAAPENDDALTKKYLKSDTSKEDQDTLAKMLENRTVLETKENEDFTIRSRCLPNNKNSDKIKICYQTLDFQPTNTSTQISNATTDLSESDSESNFLPIFQNLKFIVEGFNEEIMIATKKHIELAGGTVIDKRLFKGVCDYAIFPVVYKSIKLPPVQEIVNNLWLHDSLESGSLITDIQYYHRSIDLPSTDIFNEFVITISSYEYFEREFLKSIIIGLGGIFQELFAKKSNQARNLLASTHLISPIASGKKYEAALKWNLPVTTKDWLLECAKTGKRLPLNNYLIGKTDNETTNSNIAADNNSVMEQQNKTPEKNDQNNIPKTPVNNLNQKNSDGCSQVTPINKILQDAIKSKVLPTPPSPKTYYPWDPKTPETPLGAFIRPNPSPALRKEMQKYVNSFPDFVPPKRRISTPLSELKRRLVNKITGTGEYSQTAHADEEKETQQPPDSETSLDINNKITDDKQQNIENTALHQKLLQELQQKVIDSANNTPRRSTSGKFEVSSKIPGIESTAEQVQSQVCTISWDYEEDKTQNPKNKIFLLSGIEDRERIFDLIQSLGAPVLDSSQYVESATHLICSKPGRNEKTLACMAAGKWILHLSYIEKSVAANYFLNEEEFEFGNVKAKGNIFYEEQYSGICYWRKEISRRGYGAFNDMRAIIIAEKKDFIKNIIEAGGGAVVNVKPPFDDPIHATHCLMEIKSIKDMSLFVPLAQQGIKCVNTIYINDFLFKKQINDLDYIIPYFSKYYK